MQSAPSGTAFARNGLPSSNSNARNRWGDTSLILCATRASSSSSLMADSMLVKCRLIRCARVFWSHVAIGCCGFGTTKYLRIWKGCWKLCWPKHQRDASIHPLPNPSPVEGEGLRTREARCHRFPSPLAGEGTGERGLLEYVETTLRPDSPWPCAPCRCAGQACARAKRGSGRWSRAVAPATCCARTGRGRKKYGRQNRGRRR